jgi:translation elongation factor EF-1alpha
MKKIGFGHKNIRFVPLSSENDENITSKPRKMPWYNGLCLL